ncbi:MAG: GNAT family N-acetyltransferase, partial [Bacteroidota bacterium]|nr:GNAT family N-acetyltransferase [Bacteroidota bacterium]
MQILFCGMIIMHVQLQKAGANDCSQIHQMQCKAFECLLDKYHDYNTNPSAEPLEKVIQRMEQDFTDYYFIQLDGVKIGAIRVIRLQGGVCRISPIFILPEFQGKRYAQQAIKITESLYPKACRWELDTIKQERKLCYLYEKMGYVATGKEEDIQPGMTIIF